MFSRACRHLQKKLVHPDMYFSFDGWVKKVASSEYEMPCEVYRKALDLHGLSKTQRKHLKFSVSKGSVSPDDPLEDNSAPGLSIASAVQISVLPLYFKFGKKVRALPAEGRTIFGDMADPVRTEFSLDASCKEQVIFTSGWKAIDL
jgi:hypothetical protein